jgi:dTDP-4-dehydrorhamnose 3,5-epimerase
MKFIEQGIKGVFLIEAEPFVDNRGAFRRHFCQNEFGDHGLNNRVVQANISENFHAFTLRGFHYQLKPYQEAKTLSCLSGKIYDIVVDLRKESPSFMQWISVELSKENRKSLHIAPGCANAFVTLEDNTILHYYHSEKYTPGYESGIRYNDPAFDFKWPVKPRIISKKDMNHPDFDKNKFL